MAYLLQNQIAMYVAYHSPKLSSDLNNLRVFAVIDARVCPCMSFLKSKFYAFLVQTALQN